MKETLKNIKVIYRYGKEYRRALIFETIGSIIGISISIALPVITAKQVVYITNNSWYQLLIMSLVVLALGFLSAFKTVLIRKNTQKFTVGVTEKLQKQLSKEILKISQTDIDNNSTGLFVRRMTSDTDELANMFTVGYGRLVGIITSIGTLVSVFIINKVVFLFYLIATLSLTVLHLIKSQKYKLKDREKRNAQDKVTGLTSELIRGIRDIKMLHSKESFVKVLNKHIKIKNEKYLEMRNVEINYNIVIDSLTSVFEFGLIVLFIFLISHNLLTVAMAIALYSYRDRLMSNFMERLSQLFEEINSFNLSFERVFALLDNKTFQKEQFGSEKIDKIKGDFEFKDVVFSYNKDNRVLNELSFKVKANSTVGFVGPSGSGKTTIFNLLCRMYNIESGKILIDNKDINNLDEGSIRGNITIIGQSPYIFNMSIIDNMKLVKENVTIEEVKEACRLACLDDYIESLPDKYDSIVGEGGVTLSGGQKQRLAIARALIQKTKIILFDEATSALDNETQKKIQEAINNLKKDYTIMIIAHRFSTVLNCDKIFFIKNGKVLKSGTHEELLKKCKDYKNLYEAEIKDQ